MAYGSITLCHIDGEIMETVTDFIFLGSKITVDGDWSYEIKRCFLPGRKNHDKHRQHIKKSDINLPMKVCSQSYGISHSHVWVWDSDHKEAWTLKNWCFRAMRLENTLESPLNSKEIKLVNPKGNQPWLYIGRTNGEAEAPVVWPLGIKSQLILRLWCCWKDWRQENGMTEDEMVGWHNQLNGHEFE